MITVFTGGLVEASRRVPTAVIMANPDNAVLGSMVRLNAFASSDPDDAPLTYKWEFVIVPVGSVVIQEGFRGIDTNGVEVSFSPDVIGQYVVKLTVSNGVFESFAQQLISVRSILVPHGRGIIPDGKFIWSYIRDVWQGVDNKEIFETLWSALIQIAGGELLKTYQVDFNKSIRDIQDLYQRRWLNYDPRLDLDDSVSLYLGNQLAGSGASTVPLGTQGRAVILKPNELVVARGSVLPQVAGETLSILFSSAQANVGDYSVKAQNKTKNGYLLDGTVADAEADVVIRGVRIIFEFQSKVWTFAVQMGIDYALLMSKYPSDIDVLGNVYSGQSDAVPAGLRVGDVIHFPMGPNAGFYVVETISGNYITVDKAPPGASPQNPPSPYLADIYHPVGFTLTQAEQVLTSTVSLPYRTSDNIGELAKGRVITVNGQAFVLARSYVDMNQAPPMEIVVTDNGELLANQSNFNWRVPYTLYSETQNFEELGVAPGDVIVAEVTSEVSHTFCEVRAQVVGVTGNRIGFLITDESLTPGVTAEIPDQIYVDLSKNLGIDLAEMNRDGDLVLTGDVKRLVNAIKTTGFAREYLNRPITPTTDINILGGTFRIRPQYVIRNSKIPVPDLLRSVPLLQEWIVQPTILEKDGKVYQVKNDKEYEIPRKPTTLAENLDYLIDDTVVFKGELFLNTGTNIVYVESGFFQDRGLAPGDIFEITSPVDLAKPYRIVEIYDQQHLRLNLPIPTQSFSNLPFASCKVKITRRAGGRYLRFVPGIFGPKAPAPDRFWGEVSLFDNSDAIENNFGLLVGLTKADLDTVSQSINYRQAVAGLMFAFTRGPDVNKMRLGAQILLGLPFSEHDGIIRSIENDFRLDVYGNPVMGRILIEDVNSEGTPVGTLRVYTFPIDYQSSDLSGVETNPNTGKSYAVGDVVPMFTALCKGVEVLDYISSPLVDQASARQKLQQFHSFRLRANDNIFNMAEIGLVSEFLRKITPSYISYVLQTATTLFDTVRVVDVARLAMRFLGGAGSGYVDDEGTGLATPFMYDLSSAASGMYGYWGNGFLTPRRFGSDLHTVKLVSPGPTVVSSVAGGFVTPQLGEGPVVRSGDKLLIIDGTNKGIYTIGAVTETTLTLTDAPTWGFEAATDLPFIVLRPVREEMRRGTAATADGVSRDMTVELGLRRDGVMPGDWLLLDVGSGVVQRYDICDVKESIEGVWNVLTLDRPAAQVTGASYRIYRPNLITAPYMEEEIQVQSLGNGSYSINSNWVRALMDPEDEIVLADGLPILTIKAVDAGSLYLDQSLPASVSYRGYLKKRGHLGAPAGFDLKLLFPSDQVTVDLIGGSAARPVDSSHILAYATADDVANLTKTWHLNNTPAEAAAPLPGDKLVITTGADALTDIGHGPGVYPILSVTSDASWVHLHTIGQPTVVGGQGYRIRRVLPKTQTFPQYELPFSYSAPPPPPPPPPSTTTYPVMLVAARRQDAQGLTKVARSYDGGATWAQITNAPFGWGEFFSTGTRLLYVETLGPTNQMAYSVDDGNSWTSITGAPDLTLLAAGNGVVVGVNATGIYRSTNDGDTWQLVPGSVGQDLVTFDGSVFIVIRGDGITLTSSDGLTWTPGGSLPAFASFGDWESYWFSVATNGNGAVMASVPEAVVISTNHGQSWSMARFFNPDNWEGYIENVAYASDYGWVLAMKFYANNTLPGLDMAQYDQDTGGMGLSSDNGATWTWTRIENPLAFKDWEPYAHKGLGKGYLLSTWRANYPDPINNPNIEVYANGVARVTPLVTEWVPMTTPGYVPEAWFSGITTYGPQN